MISLAVSLFAIRLAFGLLASLLLLIFHDINPRFFRTHFLTAFALVLGGTIFAFLFTGFLHCSVLIASCFACFLGSVVWMLGKAPGGRSLIVIGALVTAAALSLFSMIPPPNITPSPWLADDFSSSAFLGLATTSMLLGHSYLNAPSMSIKPLQWLLAALGVSLLLRMAIALYCLWLWTNAASADNLETEVVVWLAARWGVGILIPLILGWMSWETARIRSTQSATGILYVLVICAFLGELTSQLLFTKTGILV